MIASVNEIIPTVKQEAAIFALASMKVLRYMGAWGKTCRIGQGINTLVPMGAPRAAGISPAASMSHHREVMSHLAKMVIANTERIAKRQFWAWSQDIGNAMVGTHAAWTRGDPCMAACVNTAGTNESCHFPQLQTKTGPRS